MNHVILLKTHVTVELEVEENQSDTPKREELESQANHISIQQIKQQLLQQQQTHLVPPVQLPTTTHADRLEEAAERYIKSDDLKTCIELISAEGKWEELIKPLQMARKTASETKRKNFIETLLSLAHAKMAIKHLLTAEYKDAIECVHKADSRKSWEAFVALLEEELDADRDLAVRNLIKSGQFIDLAILYCKAKVKLMLRKLLFEHLFSQKDDNNNDVLTTEGDFQSLLDNFDINSLEQHEIELSDVFDQGGLLSNDANKVIQANLLTQRLSLLSSEIFYV